MFVPLTKLIMIMHFADAFLFSLTKHYFECVNIARTKFDAENKFKK